MAAVIHIAAIQAAKSGMRFIAADQQRKGDTGTRPIAAFRALDKRTFADFAAMPVDVDEGRERALARRRSSHPDGCRR